MIRASEIKNWITQIGILLFINSSLRVEFIVMSVFILASVIKKEIGKIKASFLAY